MNTQNKRKEIIVIGGGPGGITASIQLTRYGLRPLLLERRELGGLLWNANLIENYPGFPNGIQGEKLIHLLQAQVNRIGVEVKREEVVRVKLEHESFVVATDRAERIADYLIVACGTKSKPVPDIISREAQERVFTEVWPLREMAGKRIIIVGAGDAAFDYALNLSKNRNFVTILNRGESVKCLGLLFERASNEENISYRTGVAVREVKLSEDATRLEIKCEARGREEVIEADHILFAIGREPNLEFLSEEVRQREQELIESGRLYFVGDVKNELYRQVAIAAGDGLRAAMQIYQRITK